jgi:hypothetical protein
MTPRPARPAEAGSFRVVTRARELEDKPGPAVAVSIVYGLAAARLMS